MSGREQDEKFDGATNGQDKKDAMQYLFEFRVSDISWLSIYVDSRIYGKNLRD
jgi:hypothetical protein